MSLCLEHLRRPWGRFFVVPPPSACHQRGRRSGHRVVALLASLCTGDRDAALAILLLNLLLIDDDDAEGLRLLTPLLAIPAGALHSEHLHISPVVELLLAVIDAMVHLFDILQPQLHR